MHFLKLQPDNLFSLHERCKQYLVCIILCALVAKQILPSLCLQIPSYFSIVCFKLCYKNMKYSKFSIIFLKEMVRKIEVEYNIHISNFRKTNLSVFIYCFICLGTPYVECLPTTNENYYMPILYCKQPTEMSKIESIKSKIQMSSCKHICISILQMPVP